VDVVKGVYGTNILIPSVKPFLSPKKERAKQFFDIDDGPKPPIMNLDIAKYILLPWPPTSEKPTAG
jgi:hypothetical protein